MIGATPVAQLDIDVANLRNDKGLIRICLTADPENFPACVDDKDAIKPIGRRQRQRHAVQRIADRRLRDRGDP